MTRGPNKGRESNFKVSQWYFMNSLMAKCRYIYLAKPCYAHSPANTQLSGFCRGCQRHPRSSLQFAGSLCLETRSAHYGRNERLDESKRIWADVSLCWSLCATNNFAVELQIIENEIVAVILIRELPINLILLIRLTYSFGHKMEFISVC